MNFFSRVGFSFFVFPFSWGFRRQAGTANKFQGTWRNCLRVILNFEVRDVASEPAFIHIFICSNFTFIVRDIFDAKSTFICQSEIAVEPRNRIFFRLRLKSSFQASILSYQISLCWKLISWKIMLQRDFCGKSWRIASCDASRKFLCSQVFQNLRELSK